MLSSVLTTQKAIQINIEIMRAFARYRAILPENKALGEKLNQAFQYLLDKIDALTPQYTDRPRIGFKTGKEEE